MNRRLIAIMLSRLQITVDECVDAYVSLSDWNLRPSGLLEDKVKCLVSIGTGVRSLTPFKSDLPSTRIN